MPLRAVAFAAALALAATVAATATGRPNLLETCLRKQDHATIVTFRAGDGTKLVGAELGRGRVAIVAGHELNLNFCSWIPFARAASAAGFRVLAIDFRGFGESADGPPAHYGRLDLDLRAAAAYLRRHGARTVFYAGASMGGTAAIVAATQGTPPAGVIDLSGPASFGPLDAARAARHLQRPFFVAAGRDDAGFVDDSRRLFAAAPVRAKHLAVLPGGRHGTELLNGAGGADLRRRLLAFLRASS